MTDKVQKIREEVVRMHNLLPVMDGDNIYLNYADRICTTLEMYIDSLQKEPVSEKKCMFSNDNYTDEDRKVLCEDCKEKCAYAIAGVISTNAQVKEEPVSEDLEEAGKEWLKTQLDKSYANYGEAKMMELTHFDGYAMLDAIEFGANWQKQKDNNDANHALVEQIKTQQMWYEKGMADMKQKMMANAVDATVHIDAGGYPYIPQIELYDYEKDIPLAKKGDKYKVILIKE